MTHILIGYAVAALTSSSLVFVAGVIRSRRPERTTPSGGSAVRAESSHPRHAA